MNTQQIHNFMHEFSEIINKYKVFDDFIRVDVSDPRKTMFLKRKAYQMLDLYEITATRYSDSMIIYFSR